MGRFKRFDKLYDDVSGLNQLETTENQRNLLAKYGYTEEQIARLNKDTAAKLINNAIMSGKTGHIPSVQPKLAKVSRLYSSVKRVQR